MPPITVQTWLAVPPDTCWKIFTDPTDIVRFNNPFPDWHTAQVIIDFKEGGRYFYRMEKKDGSEGFDFAGTYKQIIPMERIEYSGDDGRSTIHLFAAGDDGTRLTEIFEPDAQTPLALQEKFCANLLASFKQYAEHKLR